MQSNKRNNRQWERIFGRLHRITYIAEQSTTEAEMPIPFIPEGRPKRRDPRTLSPGIDVAGNRDSVGPTDPEVFSARRPTPPPDHCYDLPRQNIPHTMTPTSQLIRDILDELGQSEARGTDVAGNSDQQEQPTYANDTPPMSIKKDDSGYVEMTAARARDNTEPASAKRTTTRSRHLAPNEEETGSASDDANASMVPPTPGSSPASPTTPPGQPLEMPPEPDQVPPADIYDIIPPAQPRIHNPNNQARRPIPQGSPTIPRPREVPIPPYYRDYSCYEVMPAYHLICHSCWYVQVDDIMAICTDCASAEHTFCINDRPNLTWRQFHLLSRNFIHTSMHCGRCYKLLLKTQRAIDCYTCRIYVITHNDTIERLSYRLLCDRTIRYPPQ